MFSDFDIRRGDIIFVDFDKMLNKDNNFSFQVGSRPCIVLQNDTGNRYSPTITVAIITSKNKTKLPTHVKLPKTIGLKYDSTALIEQTTTIDKKMIIKKIGRCPEELMRRIDVAIMIQMGIFNPNRANEIIDTINKIDERAMKYGYDIEDADYRATLISELKMYCEQFNYDYLELLTRRQNNYVYKNVI